MAISKKSKSIIAITMGDPAGVGGEVALKALARRMKSPSPNFCIFGDYDYLVRNMKKFKVRIPLVRLEKNADARRINGKVGVVDLGGAKQAKWGKISASNGKAAVRYITEAARAALYGKVDAIVTAPISKEAIHSAGFSFPGHTELLAHLSKTKSFAMMMAGGPFKIVLQSIHVSLKESLKQIKQPLVWEKIALTRKILIEWFGIKKPRIAVAGVNPHAGENGAFGREEIQVLKPVIEKTRRKGWNVTGPHPPDTLFYWASQGRFDAVLCMYHDQGLIPFKLAVFNTGVNVTLGLPFIRTSPDHGTAFEIAGKNKADPSSMFYAMQLAETLAKSTR
jgi:4-hydroxythreonine-4-phosphate dehydrogenase